MKLNIQNETSKLKAVILGTAESNGPVPAIVDAYDPKSIEHIKAGTYPEEEDMRTEMNAVAKILEKYDVKVYRPQIIEDCNQIFTRDIALVIENKLIISNILPYRENEIKAIQYVINQIDPDLIVHAPNEEIHFEGGDIILYNDHIFIGTYKGEDYSECIVARTNMNGVAFIQSLFPNKKVKEFDLNKSMIDPRDNALHLDCCFQPVGKNKAIIHKEGFRNLEDYEYLVTLFGSENLFHIDKNEMYDMNSNILSIAEDVVISEKGFTRLNNWLRHQGITVEEVAYTEISKQEGLLRCSTLPLVRNSLTSDQEILFSDDVHATFDKVKEDDNTFRIKSDQITNVILMIRPVQFRLNEETAVNNYYQEDIDVSDVTANNRAIQEFDAFVAKLKKAGVHIIIVEDDPKQDTPDSIFPNNWISFHQNGDVVLYPMFAENRRKERRSDILDVMEDSGFQIRNIIDYTAAESSDVFLEGTGSMVLDRKNRKAYCALSARADEELLVEFCEDFEYTPIIFTAYQSVEEKRLPIYHTNVMMSIAENFALVCLEAIDDQKERKNLVNHLKHDKKELIIITEEQVCHFAGNMLQVIGTGNKRYLVMSTAAYQSLKKDQLLKIERHCDILHSDLNTIETLGGGSARCMMAEVFLPKHII